ncbi:hypothetical protein V6N13_023059 [Hibiscus sabdariffa]
MKTQNLNVVFDDFADERLVDVADEKLAIVADERLIIIADETHGQKTVIHIFISSKYNLYEIYGFKYLMYLIASHRMNTFVILIFYRISECKRLKQT